MAVTIAEFLASVGFRADEGSLKSALAKVAGFGAAVSLAVGAAFAGIMRVAESEVVLARQAESLGVPVRKLEELGYVAEQTGASSEAVAAALGSLKDKYPYIRDASVLLERVGERMRGMNDQAARLYAKRMGIDPALVPMLTRDVAALKGEFSAMYDVAGRDARAAAENSKAFLAELGKLKTMSGLLVKAVGGAFLGKLRGDIEHLRRVVMENFAKIKRIFEAVIEVVLRVGGVVGAFVRRVVIWAAALVGWYDKLDDGRKKIVQGLALFLAAWKLLNAGFLATPLGMVVAGLTAIVALIDDYLTYMEGGESYFDWGPWAASIQKVVQVLQVLWDAITIVVSAFASGLGPALQLLNEQCRWVFNTLGSLAKILWKVFSGDFSGALDEACQMLADWMASGQAIVQAFCDMVSGFFSTLWAGVTEKFPDFAAWAEEAAAGIKAFFAPAVDWLKQKLRGLTDWMPDWLKDKMGMGGMNMDVPGGPALTPRPMPAMAASHKSSEVNVESKTEITVNGAQTPEQVANRVAGAQDHAAADLARHTQGAVR
nr:MAG TPA: tail tape measure [Caudoviricetes sp.]